MLTCLSNEQGNSVIKDYLKQNKIFNVGRVGFNEVVVSYCYDTKQQIPDIYAHLIQNNAGVYGNSVDDFSQQYIEAIKSCDIHVMWDTDGIVDEAQKYLFKKYAQSATIVSNRSVEPFYFNDPWSAELLDKKVLVVSPFFNSFKEQYFKRDKIWPGKNVLPKMKLTLYKNIQSIGGIGPHNSWSESIEYMKEEISKLDFDIALLGCGSYGMPLGSFIKNKLNKSSIYIGGGLQLLFGVTGARWKEQDVSGFYNSYWIRPNINERPEKFYTIEGGCYW